MDASPLLKAHDHARAAAVATQQASDPTIAVSEHTQAAAEFANAARGTTSVEALRTLRLLEEHHRRLAEMLRMPPEPVSPPPPQAADAEPEKHQPSSQPSAQSPSQKQQQRRQPKQPAEKEHAAIIVGSALARKDGPARAQMAGLSPTRRFASSREMSSSIASNLSSARGIRSKHGRAPPLLPSVSNEQAPGNVDAHARRDGPRARIQNIMGIQPGKPTWVPPSSSPQRADGRARSAAASAPWSEAGPGDDGGYARFYSTFGSLINKISAPLAFAGLPLIQEEPDASAQTETAEAPAASPPRRTKAAPRPPSSLAPEPDLSKIYSNAAMRAVAREGHSASDSFYVVPTSGHTTSYANILTYAEKRRLEASAHSEAGASGGGDDDDFFDASETPVPLSPGARRKGPARNPTDKELRNTVEELSLENKSLKEMLDNVSKRLHAFEVSSQHSAMALAESYRFMRPGSLGSRAGDEAARKRALEAEEQLAAAAKQVERLEKDNRKMQKTLDKYRNKWVMLKAGAKARREAQGGGESVEDARQADAQG